MTKIIKQQIKLPKGTKSTGMAAVAVYLVSLEIKKNFSENNGKEFGEKYVQLNVGNVHSKNFEYRIGKNYRAFINEAIANGDLTIFKKNGVESYSNGKNAFAKGYSLNPEIYENLKKDDCFLLEISIIKREYKSRIKKTLKENKDLYGNILQMNYKELYFSENLYDSPFYDYFDVGNNKIIDSVNEGSVELKDYSDKNRFYHPLIMMNREIRKFIRSKNGELTIIDATSLVPFLLGKFITDHSEKNQWLKICASGEFYTKIAGVDKSEKEHYKKLFQVVLSGKTSKGSKLKDLENKLRKDFPSVMSAVDKINSSGKTVVSIMQKLENKIFRNDKVKNSNLWHLPMHDGVLCYSSDANVFIKLLEESSLYVLGYKLIFTKETLLDEPKTTVESVEEKVLKEETVTQEESVKSEKKAITKDNYKIVLEKIHKALNVLRVKIGKESDNFEKDLLISEQNKLLRLRDKIKEEYS